MLSHYFLWYESVMYVEQLSMYQRQFASGSYEKGGRFQSGLRGPS